GDKAASALKIQDLHGNVWEWCQDTWLPDYHGYWDGITIDQMLAVSRQKGNSQRRAIRGGSWVNDPAGCRGAYRFGRHAGYSGEGRGFRASLFFGPNDKQQGPTNASLDRAAQASSRAAKPTTPEVVEFEDLEGPPRSGEN
ncbi:MAG: formylglycine-generating enzyme family protein, partial [Pirellula sp.]